MYDPDNCGFDEDKSLPPGPNARPFYTPGHDLRVTWGEWGPEHMTVPGDACGLDISDSIYRPLDGMVLSPHNVDTMKQAMLLVVVFSWFASALLDEERARR
jgi:hypothetical protein